ncbi:MAG: hypothetical protein JWO38_4316 [Gemmataceae bacterium]|nr:hypothetical protein [Gemmataceae bacterium]
MDRHISFRSGALLMLGGVAALAITRPHRPAEGHSASPAGRAGTVLLAGAMPEPDLIALGVMAAAVTPDADLLIDSPRAETTVRQFLDRLRPERVVPVGTFPNDHDSGRRWGVTDPIVRPAEGDPVAHAWSLFPKAERAVVAPRTPADQLLQAACLAGTSKVPLFVLREGDEPTKGLTELLSARGVKEVLAVGSAVEPCRKVDGLRVTVFADAAAVAAAHRKELIRGGPIRVLVMANPSDPKGEATLAPWVAVKRRAALLLTGPDGKDAGAVVGAALKDKETGGADALIVLADQESIPLVKRANPAAGKDEMIDVEQWIPEGNDPLTLAAGRLFHQDRSILPLVFARQRLLERAPGPPKILIASNPGDGLPLLETFSRNTGRELENAGWKVTGRYGKELDGKELREQLPQQDVFLWEGHYRTLIDTYEMPKWTEPLRPSVIFLQSCLALNPAEAGLLFDRGAVAVAGSPNRTYSGSGGALSLGFFDSLSYDGRDAGGAMRHAKNFLLSYAELKEKRLGDAAKLTGANRRAAWVFTLWGDPTLKLPKPTPVPGAMIPLRSEVGKASITLTLPDKRYPATEVPPYKAEMWPGGRLAGLFTADGEDTRRLSPLAFAEVSLPETPEGVTPRLTSKVPAKNWVFRWDARRRVGYLLVLPREKNGTTLEFRVRWDAPDPPAEKQ